MERSSLEVTPQACVHIGEGEDSCLLSVDNHYAVLTVPEDWVLGSEIHLPVKIALEIAENLSALMMKTNEHHR